LPTKSGVARREKPHSVIETKAITIVELVQGLRGDLYVTLEEGTRAACLYDLLKPRVTEVLVCEFLGRF
jgi:hypothetical protein